MGNFGRNFNNLFLKYSSHLLASPSLHKMLLLNTAKVTHINFDIKTNMLNRKEDMYATIYFVFKDFSYTFCV